ncbi:hypothetical protein U5922_017550 [Aquicoccus sp. G2-2]|uniref:hypothetical protein n=1 Tax=Aquicoccus sp. G2-2 TaxID=3092120 RepID=UPI002ADF99F2|nr:hypothetical protein [Aquicoccus sp. G2-2]MEA1115184.1 hypothetical protein [Aquicoccus sp. G2-2]
MRCLQAGVSRVMIVPTLVIGVALSGLMAGVPARANGPDLVLDRADSGTKAAAPKKKTKAKKPVKKTKKPAKAKVPVYRDYKDAAYADYVKIQRKLQGYAKKDDLKGLATSRARLEKFVHQIERLSKKARGKRSVELNRILLQLKRYETQKRDKRLARYAGGILRAFPAFGGEARAKTKLAAYNDAVKTKNPVKTVLKAAEYSDARGDYHRAVKALPPDMRKLFKPMPKLR